MEVDPTLSLDEMYNIAESEGLIVVRFGSILKIRDEDGSRYWDLEYAIPAVGRPGQPHTQRLVKVTEWRQGELWVMP